MSAGPGYRSAAWRWWVCGLLLLATMLNYMDRQALAQLAPDITKELGLSNEDYGTLELAFGVAFAVGGLTLGFVADRVSLRWLYPAVLMAWSAAGFATGWARGYSDLMVCRIFLGFFEAGQWPCALTASQRLLSQRDRSMGNSLLQSGAALGAVITPLVVQRMASDIPGAWREPFRVIGMMGIAWTVVWMMVIRAGDLDRAHAHSADAPKVATSSPDDFVRRFCVLIVIVIAINFFWQFYRAWLPKMLRDEYGYGRAATNYFTSAFYIATDIGCLSAGFAVKLLSGRGWSVHSSRVLTFLVCAVLTGLGAVLTVLPAGPAMLVLLLVIGAGALGLFPIYYSFSQELSSRHQGKVTGSLGCIAWLTSALMQRAIGRYVDHSGSYSLVLFITALLPLTGLVVLVLFWDRRRKPADLGGEI